ncbi:MarR family transcriptional regulator [Fulvimarina endophytica]|uniref:MarR family transcriptional regulator n=1 Tax=Fulvimarina endophytica TaxID=2293836 RepID=A0A371X2Y8_9HYPH|nr:MarR family winged helix-turn-helix transcriptional regulator [Fulvimarina endophytica]RFC63587.1 MarR family transcriptional regulator [Fulvimarina endophytica]
MDTTIEPQITAAQAVASDTETVTSLLAIAKSTRAFIALLLAEIGLHPGQDQLLVRLLPNEPVSVSVLAEDLSVRPSTISKMLDRLIEKGFVERGAHKVDLRRTMVQLTQEGGVVREKVFGVWRKLDLELIGALDGEERQVLGESLVKIETLLAQRLRRLR